MAVVLTVTGISDTTIAILAVLGYLFAVFLWMQGYKTYALVYSLIWTNALFLFIDETFYPIIKMLIWMNIGLLVINYKLLANRVAATFRGQR